MAEKQTKVRERKPKDPNAPKKPRAKPEYRETTKLARRQGALVGLIEKLDSQIKVLDGELAEKRKLREKHAEELRGLLESFSARAAGVLGQKTETPEPPSSEESS